MHGQTSGVVGQKPREIAARALLRHAEKRGFLEDIVDHELGSVHVSPADRGLVQELCYGVLRWRGTLDWLIDRQARQGRTSVEARVLLRLGLYQLFWLDRIPAHAAVHETVEAARALELGPHAGFLNAILREYTRTAAATRALLADLRLTDPAVGWSHPSWLVQRWSRQLSPDELQRFLEWNNTPALTYARVNTLKTDAARLIAAWRDEDVDYDFGRWDWIDENQVFVLRRHPPLARLRSFRAGFFYIQDPSTLLAVRLLDPQPGERILDFCAAPGGKAGLIAQALDNDGHVVATEPDDRRRSRLLQNCDRLGADVEVVATEDPRAAGPFDAILVDAPCSNTGVLRRRLDARWRLRPEDIERFRRLHAGLLDAALSRLRPGGRLVYSTCSVEPDENDAVIDEALARHPDLGPPTMRLLHPARDRVDGAFAALLRRSGSH